MNQHYIVYIIRTMFKNPFIVENFQRQNVENIGEEIENVEQTYNVMLYILNGMTRYHE